MLVTMGSDANLVGIPAYTAAGKFRWTSYMGKSLVPVDCHRSLVPLNHQIAKNRVHDFCGGPTHNFGINGQKVPWKRTLTWGRCPIYSLLSMGKNFLQVIPTLTHYPDIVSDLTYYLEVYLHGILALYLTLFLTFCLAGTNLLCTQTKYANTRVCGWT